MALQSQLGTNESVLASTMAMGIPVAQDNPAAVDSLSLTEQAFAGPHLKLTDSFTASGTTTAAQEMAVTTVDTLTLTDEVFQDLARVEDSMSPSESASVFGDRHVSLSDSLSLTEQLEAAYDVVDTLSLSDSADIPEEASDTLVLSEEAELASTTDDAFSAGETLGLNVDYNTQVSDALTLTESVVENLEMVVDGSEELESTDEVFDPVTFTFTTVDTGLRDAATAGGPLPESVVDNLALSESATGWVLISGGTPVSADDSLALTERADFAITLDASDTLSLSDAASGDVSAVARDSLSLTESATTAHESAQLTASDTLSLTESLGFSADEENLDCKYSPFIGEGPGTAPPVSYTAAGATAGFRLQYPESGAVTDEVEIRDPNFGNKDRLSFSRVNHETRGGTLILYADPTWPKIETQVFSFSGLKKAKAEELQTFMDDYLGLEIRLIDHEDRLWTGVITEVQDPKVEDSKGRFTMSFAFEGEKV